MFRKDDEREEGGGKCSGPAESLGEDFDPKTSHLAWVRLESEGWRGEKPLKERGPGRKGKSSLRITGR